MVDLIRDCSTLTVKVHNNFTLWAYSPKGSINVFRIIIIVKNIFEVYILH